MDTTGPSNLPPSWSQVKAEIADIENQIKAKCPDMSQQLAHLRALRIMQQRMIQRQAAMNGAAQNATDTGAQSRHDLWLIECDTSPSDAEATPTSATETEAVKNKRLEVEAEALQQHQVLSNHEREI